MHDRLAEDATTVIAILYDRWTTPTLNQDLAAALDWDVDRLLAAYDEAQLRLVAAGLRIARSHGEVSICPAHDQCAPAPRPPRFEPTPRASNPTPTKPCER